MNVYAEQRRQLAFLGIQRITQEVDLGFRLIRLKSLFSALGMFFMLITVYSQPSNADQLASGQNFLPASPEISSLFSFSEIPVNFYTGQPQINIPIYTVTSGSLQVPITLSYDASGVRLDEVPGPVGMKWSLRAGGAITRSVKGQEDESLPGGIMHTYTSLQNYLNTCHGSFTNPCVTFIEAAIKGSFDTEPDHFFVTAPGLQAEFFFAGADGFVPRPYQPLKIEWTTQSPNIASFTITQIDGSRYFFSEIEETTNLSEAYSPGGGGPNSPINPFHSSWFLTKMISGDLKDTLSFEYETHSLTLRARNSESKRLFLADRFGLIQADGVRLDPACNPPATTNYPLLTEVRTKRLTKITSRTHVVSFQYQPRLDLMNWETGVNEGFQLEEISIHTRQGVHLTSFDLQYDIYSSRNYLMKLVEYAGADSLSHQFTYYTPDRLPLPIWYRPATTSFDHVGEIFTIDRELKGIDFWGYYTARHGSSPFPAITIPFVGGNHKHFPFADKSPREETTKYGTLIKVTYPTKGCTTFDYELNEFSRIAGFQTGSGSAGRATISFQPGPEFRASLSTQTVLTDTLTISPTTTGVLLGHPIFTRVFGTFTLTRTGETIGEITIQEVNNPTNLYFINQAEDSLGNFDITFPLSAGTSYLITASSPTANFPLDATVSYIPQVPASNQKGGGLRLKQMRISDGNNPANDLTKSYTYTTRRSATTSSGVLNHTPQFTYINSDYDCEYVMVYSQNQEYMGSGRWGQIGYSLIRETIHNGEVGQKVYQYSTAWEIPDEFSCNNPSGIYEIIMDNGISLNVNNPCSYQIGPKTDNSWKRGDLIREISLAANGDTLHTQTNQYAFSNQIGSPLDTPLINRVIPSLYIHNLPASGLKAGIISQYDIPIRFKYLRSSQERIWSAASSTVPNPTNYLERTTEYTYDRPLHLQMTKQRTINSDGSIHESRIKYVSDYASSVQLGIQSNLTTQDLTDRNMLALPVEQATFIDGQFTGGSLITYTNVAPPSSNLVIKPHQVYIAEVDPPLDSISYTNEENQINGLYHQYIPKVNQWYFKRLLHTYHPTGLLIQEQLLEGNPAANSNAKNTCYLWNNRQLPVAQILQASQAAVAYTSFEYLVNGVQTSQDGNWHITGWGRDGAHAQTGSTAFWLEGNNQVSTHALPAGTYTLSFWHRSADTSKVNILLNGQPISGLNPQTAAPSMHLYSTRLTIPANGVITLKGSSGIRIDELRLHPADAQMTTYCYDDALRVHTLTDVSNRSAYYEYDDLGRLQYVRDQQGNYVQGYEYNYQQP